MSVESRQFRRKRETNSDKDMYKWFSGCVCDKQIISVFCFHHHVANEMKKKIGNNFNSNVAKKKLDQDALIGNWIILAMAYGTLINPILCYMLSTCMEIKITLICFLLKQVHSFNFGFKHINKLHKCQIMVFVVFLFYEIFISLAKCFNLYIHF